MADMFSMPNVCGANAKMNSLMKDFASMESSVTAGLTGKATASATAVGADALKKLANLESMIPPLPELPNVSLPSEITGLLAMVPGSEAYASKLAALGSQFDSGLSASGLSLDSMIPSVSGTIDGLPIPKIPKIPLSLDSAVSAVSGAISDAIPAVPEVPEIPGISSLMATPGIPKIPGIPAIPAIPEIPALDICSLPNFSVPAAGGAAVEQALDVLLADAAPVIEEASEMEDVEVGELIEENTIAITEAFEERKTAVADLVGDIDFPGIVSHAAVAAEENLPALKTAVGGITKQYGDVVQETEIQTLVTDAKSLFEENVAYLKANLSGNGGD